MVQGRVHRSRATKGTLVDGKLVVTERRGHVTLPTGRTLTIETESEATAASEGWRGRAGRCARSSPT